MTQYLCVKNITKSESNYNKYDINIEMKVSRIVDYMKQ